MYKVSIPVNCDKFHRTDKKQLLNELKAFDANRVMLNFETEMDGYMVLKNADDYKRQLQYMKEACAFFKENGYEVGAWFWGLQFEQGMTFTSIKTLNGNSSKNFACPADENFLKTFAQCVKDVAQTGVDIILLNDDIRFGAWNGFGCICQKHIKMICDYLGEEISEEQLKTLILNGGKNKYRDAFLRTNRISLENYAKTMRKAVDEVNSQIRLGFCACMSSFDIDGDAFSLAKIFAGNTKPILRLIGAPYWSAGKGNASRLQTVIELVRMEASWNQYSDIEVIAEGDAFPRPRLHCAANYIEGYDMALRASGEIDGILKICVDYVSNVGYEKGYLQKYLKNKPIYNNIEKYFSNKDHTGIRVYETQKKVETMLNPNVLGKECDMQRLFYSSSASMLSSCSIPITYKGKGVTGIAFGENAYHLTDENLKNGLIIDALAAKILTDRGIDVGIKELKNPKWMNFQYICEDDNYIIAKCHSYDVLLNDKAEILSYGKLTTNEKGNPFCYRYENEKGQKFLVFNCNARENEMNLRHYANAKLIADNVCWLGGKNLPAFCSGNPNLYIQCKEDENTTVIGIWNFFEDEAIEPKINVGQKYKSAEFIGGNGTLYDNYVQLTDINPFEFRGIVLEK